MVRLATPDKTQRVVVISTLMTCLLSLDRLAFVDGISWAL